MTTTETITREIETLPEGARAEVLEFVKHFVSKVADGRDEDTDWSELSVSQAMRGMESETSPYSEDDLKCE